MRQALWSDVALNLQKTEKQNPLFHFQGKLFNKIWKLIIFFAENFHHLLFLLFLWGIESIAFYSSNGCLTASNSLVRYVLLQFLLQFSAKEWYAVNGWLNMSTFCTKMSGKDRKPVSRQLEQTFLLSRLGWHQSVGCVWHVDIWNNSKTRLSLLWCRHNAPRFSSHYLLVPFYMGIR